MRCLESFRNSNLSWKIKAKGRSSALGLKAEVNILTMLSNNLLYLNAYFGRELFPTLHRKLK
jgi:hypothetical protein